MRRPMGEWGQGSIVELPNGRYRVVVTMADGRRVWRRARTERQAQRIRRALVEERELGLDPEKWTLAVFLRSWIGELTDAQNARIRPTTLRHYRGIIEGHIIPGLDPRDRLPLRSLSEASIQRWLDGESGSARSLHHYRAVLRRALNVALRRRLITRNPALGVELPDPRSDAGDPMTWAESRRLLDTTRDDRLGFLWRLAIMTGLREAELLGLGWDDIADGTVTVTSQLQRLGGQWVRTSTKAARSLERIAIDDETMAAFEDHRRRMAAERKPAWRFHGLVFTTARGEPYHGRYVVDALHRALDGAGIRQRRFHDLRHTHQTLLRDAGVSEDARMARAGHSTVSSSRRYGRASETQDRAAVERLAERLG